jgi:hypothetical protein
MKLSSILLKIIIIGLIISGIGCGIGDGNGNPDPEPSPTPSASIAPTPKPELENPLVVKKQIFGETGNLWKPVSDTTGNMVVVLDPKWVKLFTYGCKAKLKNGNTDTLFCNEQFKCYGNPYQGKDRMHLRGNFKCKDYAKVEVLCEEEKQTVTFTVKDADLNKVCNRFG